MVLAEDIVHLLRLRPEGMSDGELSRATGTVHQRINQCCRALADQGVLVRESVGGLIHNRLAGQAPLTTAPKPREEPSDRDWFWEGSVQSALCSWLTSEGWALVQVMNTETRQQGTDIEATRGGVRLHVEVKGYPSEGTQPSNQATHYYAGALLKAVRLREQHPDDDVAMAFPDKPRYRTLLAETVRSVRTLRITVFFVAESGLVTQE
jgi:hypothetical protein